MTALDDVLARCRSIDTNSVQEIEEYRDALKEMNLNIQWEDLVLLEPILLDSEKPQNALTLIFALYAPVLFQLLMGLLLDTLTCRT